MRFSTALVAVLSLLGGGGCESGQGPLMAPHQDCRLCHDGGRARAWTVAGTWTRGAQVRLADANGREITLTGNKVGNFYTAESLAFPISVWVDGAKMPAAITWGGCNACHYGPLVITGPLMAPGQPCLDCHRAGGSGIPFTAAGTFQAGAAVDVGGATTVTNSVGNFFLTAPITFPANPTNVGGQSMEGGAPYGNCNASGCHLGGRTGGGN